MIKLKSFCIHDLFGFTFELFTKALHWIEHPKTNSSLTVDIACSLYLSVS